MNAKKTEIMVIGKDTSQHPLPENITIDITVNGNSAKRVTHFTYLGAKITSDGKIDKNNKCQDWKGNLSF